MFTSKCNLEPLYVTPYNQHVPNNVCNLKKPSMLFQNLKRRALVTIRRALVNIPDKYTYSERGLSNDSPDLERGDGVYLAKILITSSVNNLISYFHPYLLQNAGQKLVTANNFRFFEEKHADHYKIYNL